MSNEAAHGFMVILEKRYRVESIRITTEGICLRVIFDAKVKLPPNSFMFLETPTGEYSGTFVSPNYEMRKCSYLDMTILAGVSAEAKEALESLNSLLQ